VVTRRTVTVASLLRIAGIESPTRQTIRVARHRHYGGKATVKCKSSAAFASRGIASKGAMAGHSAAASTASVIPTDAFWNSQRRDCGRYIRRARPPPVP